MESPPGINLAGVLMDDNEFITIPNPFKGLAPIRYDLRLPALAERRLNDIGIATTATGQDLLAIFNKACFELAKVYADLQLQLTYAMKRVNDRKAILIVDVIPDRMKAKGLQQNEVTRQAFLTLDEEYNAAYAIQTNIEAIIIYVEKQLKAMEGALSSVKKIFDASQGAYRRPNPNLITTGINPTPDIKETKPTVVEYSINEPPKPSVTTTAPSKYGKPNYGPSFD